MTIVQTNTDDEIERIGATDAIHKFTRAVGPQGPILWHYVTAGPDDGETIIFLHGNGESWHSWHHQISHFADRFKIVAIDIKGYGQSDKSEGNWHWENVAEEALALFDHLGLAQFNIVAHDRGAVLADYLAGNHPERIIKYVRMSQLVHIWEPERSPQAELFADPIKGPEIFRDFFAMRQSKILKKPISEDRKARLIREFSYPGIAESLPRYFQSSSFAEHIEDRVTRLLNRMNFPVLLIHGDDDKGQPVHYYADPANPAADQFPNARLEWIQGGGHFITIDEPEEITRRIERFLAE